MVSIHPGPPHFPATGPERQRFFHHLEWSPDWDYTTTRVAAADHPDGWTPEPPKGWALNTDRWPLVAEEEAGCTRVGPGVLLHPYAPGGAVLVAHWRKRR